MIALGMGGKKAHVAVVELEGTIGGGLKPGEFGKLFRSLEENNHVRAVVLDVDSPGGSASGSDYLYLAVQSLAKKKPVVAFIRGNGASGAYLLSCAAAKIIAIPSAIVGSIGVISMRPLVYEALDRLHVRMEVTKSDRLKDMGSMFRPPTEEEKAKEQQLVDDLFESFVAAVSEGRHISLEAARAVATGEVFTGRRALERGLVDELGDLPRAIDLAAELGNVPAKPVWVRPRRGLKDLLSSVSSQALVDSIVTRLEARLQTRMFYQRF